MSLASFQQTLSKYALPLGIGIVGFVLIVYGLIQYFGQKQPETVSFTTNTEAASESGKIEGSLVVDVEGAVLTPGVYTLSLGARLKDALDKAGGLSPQADSDYVAQKLNMAQKLTDGMKLYVPKVGEVVKSSEGSGGSLEVLGTDTELININAASESELDTLEGIGPVTAQKIIDNRPYATVEELVSKKAVGASVFEKIKPKISI